MLADSYNDKISKGYFSNPRKEMLPFLPKKCHRLLDVGCGGGDFGALVKREKNAEVWGVDLSTRAIERARDNLDHAILGEFSPSIALPDAYFDVITFNDSLEHFPDPMPALQLCKTKLAPGGCIICSLPNVRYIDNVIHFLIDMDWKYEDSGILDYTHLRFFTKKSMERWFIDAGYKVESITGINPHYWSGKKIFLLRLFFGKYVEDMKYLNYVVIARP
ncbi:MAG: class I SAM-dependent methyltransferase [Methylovulum sp.]|uniref:class I SAM-dependent methyltransferase n=1 Tax=Methylovulum sp. TaxID=1916980 RepID=UPI0026178F2B|nr:class I SAM-dependent methyltransferase [Methylovulum sp.]MDD2725355.1 class I SAM-dependent methyltransferase [Methylovulum sp.]MDD5124450.1 class I SAM-dependent methyltransferase [Methylovulum sp.]